MLFGRADGALLAFAAMLRTAYFMYSGKCAVGGDIENNVALRLYGSICCLMRDALNDRKPNDRSAESRPKIPQEFRMFFLAVSID